MAESCRDRQQPSADRARHWRNWATWRKATHACYLAPIDDEANDLREISRCDTRDLRRRIPPMLGDGFVLDDGELILNNREIGGWSFLWKLLVERCSAEPKVGEK